MKEQIKTLFEAGNAELAYQIAKGQRINLFELDVDFNNMNPKTLYKKFGSCGDPMPISTRWEIKLTENMFLSVCAGEIVKSYNINGIWKAFEVAVIGSGQILNFEKLPCIANLYQAELEIDNSGFQIAYSYMTHKDILCLIQAIFDSLNEEISFKEGEKVICDIFVPAFDKHFKDEECIFVGYHRKAACQKVKLYHPLLGQFFKPLNNVKKHTS